MKTALLVIGILAFLAGLVWIGQGTGYFPYPASSFMILKTVWVYYGLALAGVGAVVIFISRRM
jgi:hypothetical protein